jgi:hypothetical protein
MIVYQNSRLTDPSIPGLYPGELNPVHPLILSILISKGNSDNRELTVKT